jgi:hypothetical protein
MLSVKRKKRVSARHAVPYFELDKRERSGLSFLGSCKGGIFSFPIRFLSLRYELEHLPKKG